MDVNSACSTSSTNLPTNAWPFGYYAGSSRSTSSTSSSCVAESKDDSSRCLKEANGAEVSQEFGCLISESRETASEVRGRSRQDPLAV